MALLTFGTNATNTLSAFQWGNKVSQTQDAAQLSALIKTQGTVQKTEPQAFVNNGFLFVPNRGVLRLLPGDWVAVGSTGMPFIMSSRGKTADFTSA